MCFNTSYMYTMDSGSNQRWSTALTMTSCHHFHSTVTQNCQNLTQLCLCNSVRVHLYAYIPQWKVLNHFTFVRYLCLKQSKVVYSLNHDIMTSISLDSHPKLLMSDLELQQCNSVRVHLHAYIPHWNVLKHFIYVHIWCGNQSDVFYSLGSASTGSVPSENRSVLSSVTSTQKMWTLAAPKVCR